MSREFAARPRVRGEFSMTAPLFLGLRCPSQRLSARARRLSISPRSTSHACTGKVTIAAAAAGGGTTAAAGSNVDTWTLLWEDLVGRCGITPTEVHALLHHAGATVGGWYWRVDFDTLKYSDLTGGAPRFDNSPPRAFSFFHVYSSLWGDTLDRRASSSDSSSAAAAFSSGPSGCGEVSG